MLLTKSINKIFRTTLILFIIITIYTIINTSSVKTLRTNVEIEHNEYKDKQSLYLLSKDNYLVKTEIVLENENIEDKVIKIIDFLKEDKNIINDLQGYIPKNLKVKNILYENNNLEINFSSEFEKIKDKDLTITGIIYSLLEIEGISKVKLLVEGKNIKGYEDLLDKKIGINKQHLINSRSNINKVTIYYYDEVNKNEYLTPVTKYINDNREKIEIIIEELTSNIPNNLISYLPDNIKLNDFYEENDMMILNFNNIFSNNNKKINEKVNSLIIESVFENYDVNMVLLQENGKKLNYFKKKEQNK